jgi:divalent metal cation (Fe/Co/Zn/Cd) transporter
MKADSVRTILYALGANLAIAAAKTAAAIFTGSSAMLAEAIHSYADSGNQGLLLWGMRQARRPPSPDYPLGWGKAVFFWSFIVALVLFSLGGLFSLYEGWHKLHSRESLTSPWVAVASWSLPSLPSRSRYAPACMRSPRCATAAASGAGSGKAGRASCW